MSAEVAVGSAGAVIALVAAVIAYLQLRRTPSKRKPPKPVTRLTLGDIPREPLSAVDRRVLLTRIDETFAAGPFCVLLGGRGVGKTHLAAAYVRGRRSTVVWVAAEDPANTVRAYAELARRAGLTDAVADAEAAARTGLAWLETLDRPVVVFDNATDPDALNQWLPTRARVLVTTTVQDFEILGGTVPVTGFGDAEAVRFLAARSGLPADDAATGVARELGCLPLALAQAGGVIRRQRLTFATYLERLPHAPLTALLERVPGEGYPACVEDTTLESLRTVTARDSRAQALAELLSVLAARGVRRELAHRLGPDPVAVDAALGALTGASLAGFDVTGEVVTMHRLTQRALLGRLHAEERLAKALDRAFDVVEADESVDLVDHAASLWQHFRSLTSAQLAPRLGRILRLRRRSVVLLVEVNAFAQARALGREVLADHDAYLPVDHEDTDESVLSLRRACMAGDRMAEAVTLSERILERRSRLLGARSPRTINARNTLGFCCEGAGLLDRALKVHQENLDQALAALGPDHQSTLYARINVASTLRSAGRLDEAVAVFEEDLRENLRVHGPDHSSTINSRGELARTYVRIGRVAEGIALHETNAPLATSLWWAQYRAAAYSAAGRHDEAIGLLRRLRTEAERDRPADSPETIRVRLFLARALLDGGKTTEARNLFERTVEDRTRVLGPDHTGTLNARRNLGLARFRAGETEAAREILAAVTTDYRRVLGAEHPYTRQAESDLAELPAQRRRVRK
ncbi:FxSxx-COOH system tetratricopeptide repeat protein [Amycolatopsis sp. OK19-0408]|uniref:FxSxx-COOH system tetratricopeptide repeat protein n=1 Tax=Amycolatopsis iheyensis TaxID=2945988 RepID=A0A9X2SHT9_9PSEU|nr:FxSxx-COOH system tetratricopeptide repeat protein [Amycolatopsis iheyensis]MCR6482183.1 FxSxx-COOH system tetratricopeptide repeat protein [Amycolatopsis iheyensis]